jgi:hypothetical protein
VEYRPALEYPDLPLGHGLVSLLQPRLLQEYPELPLEQELVLLEYPELSLGLVSLLQPRLLVMASELVPECPELGLLPLVVFVQPRLPVMAAELVLGRGLVSLLQELLMELPLGQGLVSLLDPRLLLDYPELPLELELLRILVGLLGSQPPGESLG